MTGNFQVCRRTLSARRVALLATTIAGIGAAALVFSPGTYPHSALGGAAQAQNLTEKVQQLPQRPVGFADIVEKVKPAVISVRVKIDRPAEFEPERRRSAVSAWFPVRAFLQALWLAEHAERP